MSAMIGVDWGTSSLRGYLLEKDGTVSQRVHSDSGILSVRNRDYAATLAELLSRLGKADRSSPLLVSGMITSRNGWFETPYLECPASPADLAAGLSLLEHEVLGAIWFVPGVKQLAPEADIMRGEETQLAGIDRQGNLLVILPGTHSKWVNMQDSAICRFKTFMTGDLYSAVLDKTILRTLPDNSWAEEMFVRGVRHGHERYQKGGTLLSGMFQVRVRAILGLRPEEGGTSFLSGMLIGTEIAEGRKSGFGDTDQVLVAGEKGLVELYIKALAACGIHAEPQSPEGAAHGLYCIAKAKRLL